MHRWDSPNGVQTQPVISVVAVGKRQGHRQDRLRALHAELGALAALAERSRVQIGRDFEAQEPNSANGPGTTVTGGIDIGMPNFLPRPKYPDERRYQFIDNVTWYAGAHSLKTGVDINYVQREPDQPVPGRRHLRVSEPQRDRAPTARSAPPAARRADRRGFRPASLHQLQPGVRPARQRLRRRRLLHRPPTTTGSSRTTGA